MQPHADLSDERHQQWWQPQSEMRHMLAAAQQAIQLPPLTRIWPERHLYSCCRCVVYCKPLPTEPYTNSTAPAGSNIISLNGLLTCWEPQVEGVSLTARSQVGLETQQESTSSVVRTLAALALQTL